jgi:hypothetical protein
MFSTTKIGVVLLIFNMIRGYAGPRPRRLKISDTSATLHAR